MALVLPILLLCLFIQCGSALKELCMLSGEMPGDNFNFTIVPEYYMPNTNYTVTILGSELVGVALSMSNNNTAIGTWINNAENCTGIYGKRNLTLTETWTSPASMNDSGLNISVTFIAYVKRTNGSIYKKSSVLTKAPGSTGVTTVMNVPMSTNMTTAYVNMTTAYVNMTTAYVNMTTAYVNMTTAYVNMTTTYVNMTTMYNNITTTSTMRTTVKVTAGAITFKPLGGFASMMLLFVTLRELLL
uniref:uncharacterized protein n=1 Tax=Pristiophorus japonicus TaxID=55135 RepID=UPI00398F0DB8